MRSAALAFIAAACAMTAPTLHGQACTANPVVCENQLTGAPASQWDISGSGDAGLQGFATDISVNKGETVSFKVNTTSSTFTISIYRLGYYQGNGARLIATISNVKGGSQPACFTNASTGLIDCGNWNVSATWAVPATAVSGIYIARLARSGGASQIPFIVRDDQRQSDILFQTSDPTWQAYNTYGGNSLYVGGPGTNPGRAYKVSYNRPFTTRGTTPEDYLFGSEYPMVRYLESNGFDVSYQAGIDTDRYGATDLVRHNAFISVGHDEYWSGPQRANVEAARGAGVNLAFFSGNEMFWKTRWEASIDGSNTPYRTLVCYKETHANAKLDPADPPTWTGTWMDPRFSPPADGGRPQNAVTGTLFSVNGGSPGGTTWAIKVPQSFASQPFWRNTRVATLAAGQTATLATGTLGYEWDENINNGFRPAGLTTLSSTTFSNALRLQDYGSTYASGTATHAMTLYRHSSGALVFGAGTVFYAWGLDGHHDHSNIASTPDLAMQQATVNLFSDMGIQPGTLVSGLVPGTSDGTPPSVSVTAPAPNAIVAGTIAIAATATDNAGVAGLQFQVDGSSIAAEDTSAPYSVSWNSAAVPNGTHTITAVARDTSGNSTTSAGVTVTVSNAAPICPCSIWSSSTVPSAMAGDPAALEAGVKFQSDSSGFITGLRFYKYAQNSGTHIGNLWTTSGTLLGTVTFSSETASGWQQASFSPPIAISASTTYIASYHSNTGFYALDEPGLTAAVNAPPLHALSDSAGGGNGVYAYSSTSVFPTQTFDASNYWVDVVFAATAPGDTTPPTATLTAPANNATVSGTVSLTATAADNVGVAGVQFTLDGVALGAEQTSSPYSLSWDTTTAGNGTHTVAAVARDAAGNKAGSNTATVTVSNAGVSGLAIDVSTSTDRSTASTTISTSTFTTHAANELLLAFVATDANDTGTNESVTKVTGGSLTWQLVARTNVQRGTAEIWRALATSALSGTTVTATLAQAKAASLTVVAFTGVDTSGTSGSGAIGATASANGTTGTPRATLTTTRNGSWVIGVGNDWDSSTGRTPDAGQTLVHQYLTTGGDTFWVQRMTGSTALAATQVTIDDTSPAGDHYNLTICEVLPK